MLHVQPGLILERLPTVEGEAAVGIELLPVELTCLAVLGNLGLFGEGRGHKEHGEAEPGYDRRFRMIPSAALSLHRV